MHPSLSIALASERTADALRASAAHRGLDETPRSRRGATTRRFSRYFRNAAAAYQQPLRRAHR
jgi:hypothetical protein